MSEVTQNDWRCHGWADHERTQLLAGAAMTFRERLLWLQEADRMVRFMETKRRWIDKDGVVHERTPAAAETSANYGSSPASQPGGEGGR